MARNPGTAAVANQIKATTAAAHLCQHRDEIRYRALGIAPHALHIGDFG